MICKYTITHKSRNDDEYTDAIESAYAVTVLSRGHVVLLTCCHALRSNASISIRDSEESVIYSGSVSCILKHYSTLKDLAMLVLSGAKTQLLGSKVFHIGVSPGPVPNLGNIPCGYPLLNYSRIFGISQGRGTMINTTDIFYFLDQIELMGCYPGDALLPKCPPALQVLSIESDTVNNNTQLIEQSIKYRLPGSYVNVLYIDQELNTFPTLIQLIANRTRI
jgi:hypothetical protein